MEGGAECRGPSLAVAPLRGATDCAQDDSLLALEMMTWYLLHTDRLPETASLPIFVLHDLSALHYELDSLERGHILQRVAIDGDDVRPFTWFDRADLV